MSPPDAHTALFFNTPLNDRLFAYESPQEAWEGMAAEGYLPMAWMDNPARWFVCENCDVSFRDTCDLCKLERTVPHPKSLNSIANFVARIADFVRAEALVLEAVGDMRKRNFPFRLPPVKEFVWRRWRDPLWGNGRGVRGALDTHTLFRTFGDPRFFLVEADGTVSTGKRVPGKKVAWTERPRLGVKSLQELRALDMGLQSLSPDGLARMQWNPR